MPQVISARWSNPAPRELCESCLTPLKSSPAQLRADALAQLRLECLCCNGRRRKIQAILISD